MQEKINLGIWLTSDNTASQVPAVATEKKGHCLGRKLASADTDLYSDSENRGKTLKLDIFDGQNIKGSPIAPPPPPSLVS